MDAIETMRGYIAENPFFLAPMAGWTDAVYREICREFGSGLACTEMVSAQGLAHGSAHTEEYLAVRPGEPQVIVQLFGREPDVIAREAAHVEELLGESLAAVDINMGCPAHKVVRKGEGSALMKEPELAAEIVRRSAEAIEAPLTVKFRRGYETGRETAVEFARRMEDAGAAAVCVHGRYSRDFYHGKADWDVIARVKDAVDVPVLASGDLMSVSAVLDCLAQTGADAAAIARGAQGNPWIFQHLRLWRESMNEGSGNETCKDSLPQSARVSDFDVPVPLEERVRVARMHVERLAEVGPREVVKMRTYFAPYFRGMPAASRYRGEVMACVTLDDFERFFDRMLSEAAVRGLV